MAAHEAPAYDAGHPQPRLEVLQPNRTLAMKLVLRVVDSPVPELAADYLLGLEQRAQTVLRSELQHFEQAMALAAYLDAVDAQELPMRRLVYRAAADALCAWMLANPACARRLAQASWAAASLAQFLAEPCLRQK